VTSDLSMALTDSAVVIFTTSNAYGIGLEGLTLPNNCSKPIFPLITHIWEDLLLILIQPHLNP